MSMAPYEFAQRLPVKEASGNAYILENGRKVIDGSCGAAVSCFGLENEDVLALKEAMVSPTPAYAPAKFFSTHAEHDFTKELLGTTQGSMARVDVHSSGSDAIESGMKAARQFHVNTGQKSRTFFISREGSYHGATQGALSLSGHHQRRESFEPILSPNFRRVSACHPYRDRINGQGDEEYCRAKARELDALFNNIGGNNVIALVIEPVGGATLGCNTPVSGYLSEMKSVCHKHGALLIFDEVMCGMGRTGTLHTWEQDDVVPDIQILGKALGAGLQPVSAVLYNHRVAKGLQKGSGSFVHGHTHQSHALGCALAFEVLKRVQKYLSNIKHQGKIMEGLLRDKLNHPNVGDIRGRGLFFAVEFVQDKSTKAPFDRNLEIVEQFQSHAATQHHRTGLYLYYGTGGAVGKNGDHIIIAPQYNCSSNDIQQIVELLKSSIESFPWPASEEDTALAEDQIELRSSS